jgi:hypothetical protein
MEIIVSYQCIICSKEFYNRTPDLYNDDCELFCSIYCCETYYHDKYQYIDCEDNIQEECDEEEEEDNIEKICEACKEEFTPKNIFEKYCSKFCKDSEEENIGYALINHFSTLCNK